MPVEQIPITTREHWLALRRQDVTASVAGALLGVHEYTTPYGLWALKTGQLEEDQEETAPMRRGRLLEPAALDLLREERPDWRVSPNKTYFRDPLGRLGATPDAFAFSASGDPERPGQGIVQVKTVEAGVFRGKWRDAETGEVAPPLWIAVQAIVEAHLTGASWACVAAMVVSHGIDLHVVDVPLHPGVIERVRGAVRDFWTLVENGGVPDPDYGRDADLIERLFRQENGETIDLSHDNALPTLIAERERLAGERGAAEARLKEIRAEILAKLGPASAARLADGRLITARTVLRKEYAVKAASYRDVRVKIPNEKEPIR